jgi:hypothetical protein
VLIVLESDRTHTGSAWWALVNAKGTTVTRAAQVHGFDIDFVNQSAH